MGTPLVGTSVAMTRDLTLEEMAAWIDYVLCCTHPVMLNAAAAMFDIPDNPGEDYWQRLESLNKHRTAAVIAAVQAKRAGFALAALNR